MTLPVSSTPVANAYSDMRDKTINVRSYCTQVQTATSGGSSVSCDTVVRLLSAAQDLATFASGLSTQTGFQSALTTYVQQMVGDSTLDVTTAYDTSLAALDALVTAIVADLPQDSAGHLLDRTITSAGVISTVPLTAAQLPKTLPAITSWLATIS